MNQNELSSQEYAESINVNIYEVDGRILELIKQRDEALNRVVFLSGMLAKLQKELEVLRGQSNGNATIDKASD